MFNVPISKSGSTLQVDWDAMPKNAQDHIIAYGLKQKLNDAGSSATVKALGADDAASQAQAMAENVLSALLRGEISVRQAASTKTLEERKFTSVLHQLYKKVFKAKAEDMDDEAILVAISAKLGKAVDTLRTAVQLKAEAEAEVARKVAELKAQSPDIEL